MVDEFFQRSEQGYAAVNRGELAGEAFRLYKQDPDKAAEFRALMAGERPKVVGKIMGGGPEGEILANAFAQDPTRLAALQQSAREMETLNRMADLRLSGAGPAGKIMVTASRTAQATAEPMTSATHASDDGAANPAACNCAIRWRGSATTTAEAPRILPSFMCPIVPPLLTQYRDTFGCAPSSAPGIAPVYSALRASGCPSSLFRASEGYLSGLVWASF